MSISSWYRGLWGHAAPSATAVPPPHEDENEVAVGRHGGARRPECGHACRLTTPCCCVCSDQRPLQEVYERYADGRGVVRTATREEFYCLECKESYRRAEVRVAPTAPAARRPLTPEPERVRAASKRAEVAVPAPAVTADAFRRQQLKDCGHPCRLTFTTRCCHCMDARPMAIAYDAYTDGVGMTRTAARSAGYCPACREHNGPAGDAAAARASSAAARTRAVPASPPRVPARTQASRRIVTPPRASDHRSEPLRIITPPRATDRRVTGTRVFTPPRDSDRRVTGSRVFTPPRDRARYEAAAVATTRAAATAPPPSAPVLARVESVSSSEPCVVCGRFKLFRVSGMACEAVCKFCSSVFPRGTFSGEFVRALPEMAPDELRTTMERVQRLAEDSLAAAAARQRPPAPSAPSCEPGSSAAGFNVQAPPPAAAPGSVPTSGAAAPPMPPVSSAVTLANIAAQLCCTICLDPFQDPVTLPACGHSFCRACILSVAGSSTTSSSAARRAGTAACPLCRTVSTDIVRVAVSTELAFAVQALASLLRAR